jgi:hypothetical protein
MAGDLGADPSETGTGRVSVCGSKPLVFLSVAPVPIRLTET